MKKREKKLHLHRETVCQLDARLTAHDLAKAQGGKDLTGCVSTCPCDAFALA